MDQNDQEYKEYLEYLDYLEKSDQGAQAPAAAAKQEGGLNLKDKAMTALEYAAKPLDYLGGLSRTAAAGGAQGAANLVGKLKSIANGEEYQPVDAVGMDDLKAAFQGSAPSTSEYMRRAGVPEGASLSDLAPALYSESGEGLPLKKGGMLDPTARGAAGFVGDTLLDPLTYTGIPAVRGALKASRAGAIADKALHPVETALQASGKTMYKSAPTMKAVDALADQFNKGSVSDELFKNRITGTGRGIATKAENLADKLGTERDALLKQADNAGATLDMNQAMAPAQKMVEEIRVSRDPSLQPLADSLEERLKQYLELNPKQGSPGVNASTGSGYKSSLYNDTGNAAWDTLRRTPKGAQGSKQLARGLDQEVSASANRVVPGLGDQIDAKNNSWGKLLTTAKTFEREAKKGEGKNFITSVDGMIAPFVHHNPALLGAKKAADLSKTNWLRTKLGLGLHDLGGVPALDEALRRYMIQQTQKGSQ
jgi:hypothetical protein